MNDRFRKGGSILPHNESEESKPTYDRRMRLIPQFRLGEWDKLAPVLVQHRTLIRTPSSVQPNVRSTPGVQYFDDGCLKRLNGFG